MNKWVIIGAFLISLIIAIGNNMINDERVDWLGSPRVLEKPEGY